MEGEMIYCMENLENRIRLRQHDKKVYIYDDIKNITTRALQSKFEFSIISGYRRQVVCIK